MAVEGIGTAHGPGGYPAQWEADVLLRDGGTAHLRPITPEDADRLRRFHDAQSARSIYLRFFAPMPHLSDRDVHRFTHVDHVGRAAFVVLVADEIIGVGRYERLDPPDDRTAEVAFNIADAHQGRGIGSILLEHLAGAARERGIARFEASVLPENSKMLTVFREAGYDLTRRLEDGVVSVAFDLDPTERSLAVMTAREHRAEARSMHALLHPRAVVVVGASSRRPRSMGRRVLSGLRDGGFAGRVHIVHNYAKQIEGIPVHRNLSDVPVPVDLAVIAVPAADVVQVIRECAARGVRGAVVVSGGFAESGSAGTRLQAEMVREARALGVRILGPSSFGLLNTDPAIRLNASIAPRMPRPGGLALFSQSGAMGVFVLQAAERRGLGLSSFVSAGNRADVSGNDCMQYWLDDDRTSAVGLWLESVGNPRKFSRLARALSAVKPVMVVKSSTGEFSAPPGHTVRRTKAPPEAFDAMLSQAGVIRTEDLHQLFDVAQVLRDQPLPAGDRVAVVGNSAALCSLAAQACRSWGLQPVGGLRSTHLDDPPEALGKLIRTAQSSRGVDAVLLCLVPPYSGDFEELRPVVRSQPGVTTVACGLDNRSLGSAAGSFPSVPVLQLPEDAARAVALLVRYGRWLRRDRGEAVARTWRDASGQAGAVGAGVSGVAVGHARQVVTAALDDAPEGRLLSDDEAVELLECYGIRVTGPGGPGTSAAAPDEVSCRVASMEDPLFGPLVSFAVSGIGLELFGDVVYRIPPLREGDLDDLIHELRTAPLLTGERGGPPVDLAALRRLLGRVSLLAEDIPQVAELVLDPVVAGPAGYRVCGAEVRVAAAPARTDAGRRVLLGAGD